MNVHKIVFPDYQNSNLNIISTILANYGIESDISTLKHLDIDKLKAKKNIIFMVLDGFGYNLFEHYRNSELATLNNYFVAPLTAVFPSTTSAVITSFLTNKYPVQHSVIGWTLFFKEYAKNIDFLPNWDSITREVQDAQKYKIYDMIGLRSIFQQIARTAPDVKLFNITPKTISKSSNTRNVSGKAKIVPHRSIEQFFKKVYKIIKKRDRSRKFIYAYLSEPDKSEHQHGVFSQQVEGVLTRIDRQLKRLTEKCKNSDTLMIISADHGLIDIGRYYYVNEDKQLFNSLVLPVFPEPRFLSFFLKSHRHQDFKQAFAKYEADFLLYERTEFLSEHLLGTGGSHPKLDDFLGDYIAIAKADKAFRTVYEQNGKWQKEFTAHHAGITEDEMLVPLFEVEL